MFLIFAAYPPALWSSGWAWIPLRKVLVCLFDLRHPYLSLVTSWSHYNSENMESAPDKASFDTAAQINSTSNLLLGIGKKPSKKQKNRLLTRVDEERTVDIRTEMNDGPETF